MKTFFLMLLAVAASMLVIPAARRLAPAIGMLDLPDARKIHGTPVARVGGWGIVAGALIPLLLLHPDEPLLRAWIMASVVLFVFGLWDDARQIGHWPKFLGQALAVAIVVFQGGLYVTRLPFDLTLPPLAGELFTMVAMIGAINAVNHSDGLDGLAGGEVLLSLIAVCFLGYLTGSELITSIALAVIGGTIGFLRYNTHPAQVFMGDSGSQFLGFTLAFLVVYLTQVANTASSAALPLLLFGLPLADIVVVLYKRASGGANWFKATRNHVHHRLLDLGFSHFQSVVVIYSLQALLVGCAALLRYADDGLVIATYFAVIVALFAWLGMAERSGWRLDAQRFGFANAGTWFYRRREEDLSRRAVLWFIAVTVPAVCVFAALWAREIPQDFGALAAITLAAVVLACAFRSRAQPLVLRVAAYVAVTFATWLFTHYPRATGAQLTAPATAIIVLLALALAVFVRFMSDRRFAMTPTDFLVVFALLVLGLFWRIAGEGDDAPRFLTYAIVLFYGCEVIIGHLARWRTVLGASAFAALLVVALRGLIAPM